MGGRGANTGTSKSKKENLSKLSMDEIIAKSDAAEAIENELHEEATALDIARQEYINNIDSNVAMDAVDKADSDRLKGSRTRSNVEVYRNLGTPEALAIADKLDAHNTALRTARAAAHEASTVRRAYETEYYKRRKGVSYT